MHMEYSSTQTRPPKFDATKTKLLEAAKNVLLAEGYSGLSTRAIAAAADTQMSQIRYHFGSKEGIVLALYEYLTGRLIERQTGLFSDPNISLSTKWEVACDYLDADIASGYVRVLQELLAVGWSNPKIAAVVRDNFTLWFNLHVNLAREFQQTSGSLGPFDPEDIASLVTAAFVGAEALILLGFEEQRMPVIRALRRFGKVIRYFETTQPGEI